MRLIPEDQQKAVLARACSYIQSNYAFKIEDCAEHIRIISGEEEGLFGWIAVNYLMDGFDAHSSPDGTHNHSEDDKSSSTFGFLDMGGASTQIAFEPSAPEREKHSDNLVEVNLRHLNGRTMAHPVFVTTWLGYGTNKARERYVTSAVDSHTSSATQVIKDPCLPKSLLLSESKHPGYMLQGTGEFDECVSKTNPLLNKNAPCYDEPCLFNGVHVPAIDFSVNHFIGISEYWYSTHDVWDAAGGVYDFVDFEKNAKSYCGREWQEILSDYTGGKKWHARVDLNRLQMQCFKAAWIINILHEGIGVPRIGDRGGKGDGRNVTEDMLLKADEKGFADDALKMKGPAHFQSIDQVGDVAISWTLGKMVLEVSQSIPAAEDSQAPAINWFGAAPDISWHGGQSFRSTIGSLSTQKSYLGATGILFAILLWLCCVRGGAARRMKGLFLPSRRRSDVDVGLLSMEEGAGSSSEESYMDDGLRSSKSAVGKGISRLMRIQHMWQIRLSNLLHGKSPAAASPPAQYHITAPSPRPKLRQSSSSPVLFNRSTMPGIASYSNNDSPRPQRKRAEYFIGNGLPSPPGSPRTRSFGNSGTLSKKGSRNSLKHAAREHERSHSEDYLAPPQEANTSIAGEDGDELITSPMLSRTSSMRPLSRSSSHSNLAAGGINRRKEAGPQVSSPDL